MCWIGVVTEVVTVDEAQNSLSAGVKRNNRFSKAKASCCGAVVADAGYRGYRG